MNDASYLLTQRHVVQYQDYTSYDFFFSWAPADDVDDAGVTKRARNIFDGTSRPIKENLPRPNGFSKALYTFDIGQNDLSYGFQHSNEEQVRASLSNILSQLSQAIHALYKEGPRIFWVHNTGPVGCLPYSVIYHKSENIDQSGCVKSHNDVAREFNRQLKVLIVKLRTELSLAAFTYVDMYSTKYALISNAKNQGFVDLFEFCCGSYYGYHINCRKKEVVNGTVYGNPCKDPSKHISWDGIHYSEKANCWIANRILNGSFLNPPVPIHKACQASTTARE